jgi:hypothetical protein
MTGYQDDFIAIDKYFRKYKTGLPDSAARLQKDWILWYDKLTWLELNYNKSLWLEARERRKAFNAAKGTPEDANGMTSEDMYPNGPPGNAGLPGAIGSGVANAGNSLLMPACVIGGTVVALLLYKELVPRH